MYIHLFQNSTTSGSDIGDDDSDDNDPIVGATGGGPTDDHMDMSEPSKSRKPHRSSRSSRTPRRNRQKLEDIGMLEEEDVLLLCHLHYLPFEHGPRGVAYLKEASWLIDHVHLLEEAGDSSTSSLSSSSGSIAKGKPLKHKEDFSDQVRLPTVVIVRTLVT